jgi:hypothetical protein
VLLECDRWPVIFTLNSFNMKERDGGKEEGAGEIIG